MEKVRDFISRCPLAYVAIVIFLILRQRVVSSLPPSSRGPQPPPIPTSWPLSTSTHLAWTTEGKPPEHPSPGTHSFPFTTGYRTAERPTVPPHSHPQYDDFVVSPFTSDAISNEKNLWSQIAAAHYDFCGMSCDGTNRTVGSWGMCSPCFCDEGCEVYGDCCPDEYANLRRQPPSQRRQYNCSRTTFGGWPISTHYMVTSCPSSTERSLAFKCETDDTWHWTLTQPVTDRDSYRVYKNRYCARCHSATNLAPWPAKVQGDDPASLQHATSSAQLFQAAVASGVNQIVFSSPKGLQGRKCTQIDLIRCNQTGQWRKYDAAVERACELTTYPTPIARAINPFCILCNAFKSWSELLQERHGDSTFSGVGMPLLVLLDFSDDSDDAVSDVNVLRNPAQKTTFPMYNCSSHNMYFDRNQDLCRRVACAPGKRLTDFADNATCESFPKFSNIYGYKICLYENATTLSTNNAGTRLETIRKILQKTFRNTTLLLDLAFDYIDVFRFQRERLGELLHLYVLTVSAWSLHGESESEVWRRDEVDEALVDLVSDLETVLGEMKGGGGIKLSPTCSDSVFKTLVGDDSKVYSQAPSHRDFYSSAPTGIHLVLSHTLLCPSIELNMTEFRFDLTNLEPIQNNVNLSDGRFISVPFFHVTKSNTSFVCLSHFRKIFPEAKSPDGIIEDNKIDREEWPAAALKALKWVYFVCIIVSLIFLVVSFVIYCLLPPLRTVAGINNMLLIGAMFGGQLFLQIGYDVKMADWLCQVVGVTTHLCWLMVTFAQNTCTFHMFYTLSFPLQSYVAMSNPGSLIKKYITYVLLMSVLFVVVTLAWQYGANGDSGYGGDNCYITRMPVRVSVFAAPLFTTILVNIFMFVFTIVRLRTLQQVESTRSNRANLVLYLKLSVFVGVTWLIGFSFYFLRSLVLLYVFAVLQGCQGFFLFLAFLGNRRVIDMLVALTAGRRGKATHRRSEHTGLSGTKTTTISSKQEAAGTQDVLAVGEQ